MANIYKSNYTGSQVDDAIGKVVNGKLQEKLTAGNNISISGNTISATVPTIPSITITNGTATTPTSDTVAVISGETASGHTITNTKVNVATQAYVDKKSVAAVQYLGTVSNANELAAKNPDSVGDFCRVAAAFGSYHAGDLLLCKTLKTTSAAATWDVIHGELDKDTWTANSKTAAGYVAAGGSNANKVWKTDASGNPAWRDDANTDTNTAHTHTVGSGLNIEGSGGISGNVKYSLKVASSSEIGGVKPGATSGKTYGVAVAADGAMTVSVPWENNTDSKVTSAANHYTPSAESAAQLSADASSTTAATWNSTSLVTGVNIQRDSKGHVTGVTVDSIKMPANPNTDTGVTSVEVTGTGNAVTSASISGRKMTLTKGTTFLTSHQSLDSCAKLSGGNTFSGVQNFYDKVNIVSNGGLYVSGPAQVTNLIITVGQILYPVSESVTYEHKLPYKSGTFALTSDIPDTSNFVTLSGAQTISGNKTFNNHISVHNGPDGYIEVGNWKFFGYSLSNNGTGTSLSFPSDKNGTIALTSDIPTIEANPSLSGTKTLTKLLVGSTVYNLPSGGSGVTSVTTSGSGNAVTGASISGSTLTLTKGSTFLTSHQSLANCAKLTDQNTFNVRQITLGYWQAGKDGGPHIVYGSSEIEYTYKSGIISNSYTTHTLSFPKKSGTFALTSDIPSTSSFVTLSDAQTISGNKTFTGTNLFKGGTTQFLTSSAGINDPKTDVGASGIHCQTGGNPGTYYMDGKLTNGTNTLTLPLKTGTVALTSDIDVTAAGNNTFTGTNRFQGGNTYFMTESPRPGSPSTSINSEGVHCQASDGVGTYYMDGKITHGTITLTLPFKAGTLATTSDIPIKSATLSDTTLTLTI